MIYDCFTFFNELDLLDLRLHELNDTIDYFVLVESRYTFTNQRKPLYFEQNKNMFQNFSPKLSMSSSIILTRPKTLKTLHFTNRLKTPLIKI